MGNFDLLNLRNPGVDTTSGFNVHTIAIEVPKNVFAHAGDTDGKIGVWATASRQQVTHPRRTTATRRDHRSTGSCRCRVSATRW